MVTNYPQQLTAAGGVSRERNTRGSRAETVVARALGRLGRFLCGVRGHDAVLHFEDNRVMMRCTSCGHDTPGWEISRQGPRKRYEGDARRHHLTPQIRRLTLRKSA